MALPRASTAAWSQDSEGGSTTTRSKPRCPASMTERIASAGMASTSPRWKEDRRQPCERGQRRLEHSGQADPALAGDQVGPAGSACLLLAQKDVQTPPSGSASMRRVRTRCREAASASEVARTLAPAPPRPPATQTTCPALVCGSTTSANSSTELPARPRAAPGRSGRRRRRLAPGVRGPRRRE